MTANLSPDRCRPQQAISLQKCNAAAISPRAPAHSLPDSSDPVRAEASPGREQLNGFGALDTASVCSRLPRDSRAARSGARIRIDAFERPLIFAVVFAPRVRGDRASGARIRRVEQSVRQVAAVPREGLEMKEIRPCAARTVALVRPRRGDASCARSSASGQQQHRHQSVHDRTSESVCAASASRIFLPSDVASLVTVARSPASC